MIKGVSRIRQFNFSTTVDYGYVIIPYKVDDRDEYVKTCYNRERVTIVGDNGVGMIKDCYISKQAIRDVDFPEDDKTLGSMVAFISNPYNNKPVIIGVVSKESESQLLEEAELRLEKIFKGNHISIVGKTKTGDLFIDVENNSGKGSLNIDVTGSEEGSVININVKGSANINAEDEINLVSLGVVNLKSVNPENEDEFINLSIDKLKLKVNEGSEPLVLGNNNTDVLNGVKELISDLKSFLNTFSTSTAAATVEPTLAPASNVLKTSLLTLDSKLSSLETKIGENNSEISFTD